MKNQNSQHKIIVEYLNPITCFDISHINSLEAWNLYNDKCSDMGVGCLIPLLFQNNKNKNVKTHDNDNYLAFHVNLNTLIDTPPKWRIVQKNEYYSQIKDQILNKILVPESFKHVNNCRVANYVLYVMDEEFKNTDSFRKKNTISEIDKIAKNIANTNIVGKGLYLHESGYYDTDTLSE